MPAGTSTLGKHSLAGLRAEGQHPWAQGATGWDTYTASLPPTHHPKSLAAAQSVVRSQARAQSSPSPPAPPLSVDSFAAIKKLARGGGLCGATEQELPVHQRRLWQLVPPARSATSRQPHPRDAVGLGWSHAARLQRRVTKGSTTQTPHHTWWSGSTPSGLTKPHTRGSHLENGSLPQMHTKAPGCDGGWHSPGEPRRAPLAAPRPEPAKHRLPFTTTPQARQGWGSTGSTGSQRGNRARGE